MNDANVSNSSGQAESRLPVTGVVPIAEMRGDSETDTELLQQLAERARSYLGSFPWCTTILESYFGGGVGKIFALFLFHMVPARPDVDEWLWVAVGDIPSAYLVIDDSRSPREAFEMYSLGMREWIELARQGQTSPDVPSINVPPTPKWADELDRRLTMLGTLVKPFLGVD